MADPRTTRRVFLGRAGSFALASSLAGCGIEGTLERAQKAATPIPTIRHPKVAMVSLTGSVETGKIITGLEAAADVPNAVVFHAGTTRQNGYLVTSGGRVLTIVGRGATYRDAIETAYSAASKVSFDGMQFRRDIGRKAL